MPSPLDNAITLEDVFALVTGKRVPLAPELAGYLALEIADKADAASGGANGGSVDPRSVYIADEGTVALVRPHRDASGDAEQSIREILGQLLDASGSSTPALMTVSRRARAGSLRALMEDIEAALIPVNRAAGRRALARLAREVKRVTHGVGRNAPAGRSSAAEWNTRVSRPPTEDPPVQPKPRIDPGPIPGGAPSATRGGDAATQASAVRREEYAARSGAASEPPPGPPPAALFDNPSDVDSLLEQFSRSTTQSEQAVSRDLKGLVDIGETAAPPVARPKSMAPAAAADVDDLLAMTDEPEPAPPPVARPPMVASDAPPPRAPVAAPAFPPPSERPPSVAPKARPRESSLPGSVDARALPTYPTLPVSAEWSKPRKKRTDYWIIIALLGVLAAASAAVWLFKPGFLSGRTAEKVAEEREANEKAREAAREAQVVASCHAALDVTDVPTGAEVLLRVGQAPVDVPHLPVGARLEFVATAEGFAPKRVVVPGGATWEQGSDGKPRFELAVQLDPSTTKAKLGDPWPPGEAGSQVGGKGAPGVVHLVSTPRGAEIWMLAGLGPEALVEQLPCDQPVDILVAGPTTFRKRLHAAGTDFVPRPGEAQSKLAKVSAR